LQIYAKLIGRILASILDRAKLAGVMPNEVSDLRKIETTLDSNKPDAFIHIYEGRPSTTIGHYIPKTSSGTSYFDRLWRTGAGKHADMKKRYIIAARTIGDQYNYTHALKKPKKSNTSSRESADKTKGGKSKKRSAEKQQRRNERRLLKRQQEQTK
jgi:hypothetical protein